MVIKRRISRLRTWVAFALAGFVIAAVGVLLVLLFNAYDRIQEDLFESVLRHEIAELLDEYPEQGAAAIPHSAELQGYVVSSQDKASLPKGLKNIPVGVQGAKMSFGDAEYRVATARIGDKVGYITYNVTSVEEREQKLKVTALLLASFVVLLAFPLGVWVSRLCFYPVNQLAEKVAQIKPGKQTQSLARDFQYEEVAVIARAFDRFILRMEEFILRERQFTADVSHELRTPLAVIQGAVEVMQQRERSQHNPAIKRIERAVAQISELVEAFLFLARDKDLVSHDSKQLYQIKDVVTELVETNQALNPQKSLSIEIAGTCEATAPHMAIVIVVGNLLKNALEHGGDTVHISVTQRTIVIDDNGRGMKKENLQRAFERGYSGSQSFGLGLYLAQRVAQRYGWHIRLQNKQDNQGLLATVLLAKEL